MIAFPLRKRLVSCQWIMICRMHGVGNKETSLHPGMMIVARETEKDVDVVVRILITHRLMLKMMRRLKM